MNPSASTTLELPQVLACRCEVGLELLVPFLEQLDPLLPLRDLVEQSPELCLGCRQASPLHTACVVEARAKGVDIVEYPDSGKVASVVGTWPNVQRFIFKKADGAQYFDGESDAEG